MDRSDERVLRKSLSLLMDSPSGRSLLEGAIRKWGYQDDQELLGLFQWGEVSRTDAVLTRHYDPLSGKEVRERQVTIYLKQGQSLGDLVLDVAHELTHAVARPSWDPYDPELTASKYIWAAIEEPGGEIEALISECQVASELAGSHEVSPVRCLRYLKKDSQGRDIVSREKVQKDFYRVGKHWQKTLQERFTFTPLMPLLSAESPKLYSSTGNAPYPVALLREFDEISRIACENSRRRLKTFSTRAPAGLTNSDAQDSTRRFLARRCLDPS